MILNSDEKKIDIKTSSKMRKQKGVMSFELLTILPPCHDFDGDELNQLLALRTNLVPRILRSVAGLQGTLENSKKIIFLLPAP